MYRKKFSWILVLALLATVMIGLAWDMRSSTRKTQAQQTVTTRKTTLQKWEVHVTMAYDSSAVAKEANTLGDQGWELVSVVVEWAAGPPRYVAYFKRPKS